MKILGSLLIIYDLIDECHKYEFSSGKRLIKDISIKKFKEFENLSLLIKLENNKTIEFSIYDYELAISSYGLVRCFTQAKYIIDYILKYEIK
jgi:hypothetical protein